MQHLIVEKNTRIVALFIFTVMALAPVAHAAEIIAQTHPTLRTPFDSKISGTGFFDLAIPERPKGEDMLEMELLFRLARRMRYVRDAGRDHWQSPDVTEKRHAGDCEDKAIWLFSRLYSEGFTDIKLVIGKYKSMQKNYHVWVAYEHNGSLMILDPSIQNRPWKSSQMPSGFYIPKYSYTPHDKFRHRVPKMS